jgi:hypothetical protein
MESTQEAKVDSFESEEISAHKMGRLEDMIEQLVFDTLLAVLNKIGENQAQVRQTICYKSDCPLRDDIPF